MRKFLKQAFLILRWPAAAAAVGVFWGCVETVIVRTVFNSGTYFSRSLSSALNGRIIFYGLLSLTLWALIMLGALLGRRVFGPRVALAKVSGWTVALWAAAAAWVNLTIATSYLIQTHLSTLFHRRFAFIMLGAASSLIIVTAFIILIIKLRHRFSVAKTFTKYAAYSLLVAALTWAAIFYGYGHWRMWSRPIPSGFPNVVFITLDAWRADAFRDDISPGIKAYARKNAIIFTNARVPSTWTLPSFAATFTGSYNVTGPTGLERRNLALTTWAEAMRDGGYDTYAVFHNPHLDTTRFLLRGFSHFDYVRFNSFLSAVHYYDTIWYFARRGQRFAPETPGEANRELTDKTISFFHAHSRRPKFIWVHYLDPHYPYQPKAEILRERAPGLLDKGILGTDRGALLRENADALRALYESEVETVDGEVARLLVEIAAEPNTLVIISADHGEEFFEHGGTRHGRTVYDEVCRVPLLISLPKPDRGKFNLGENPSPVSLVDVPPSVLTYLGLPVPSSMEGRDDILSDEIPDDREIFVALNCPGYLTGALIAGDKKVLATLEGDGVRSEYYDLSADPGEQKPLPWDAAGAKLQRELITWLNEHSVVREEGAGGPSPFGDRADLRALGYM
jgi:hypothetical protein